MEILKKKEHYCSIEAWNDQTGEWYNIHYTVTIVEAQRDVYQKRENAKVFNQEPRFRIVETTIYE